MYHGQSRPHRIVTVSFTAEKVDLVAPPANPWIYKNLPYTMCTGSSLDVRATIAYVLF